MANLAVTASIWAVTAAAGRKSMRVTAVGFWAVTAVMALQP